MHDAVIKLYVHYHNHKLWDTTKIRSSISER
jgi:hypothetical protein